MKRILQTRWLALSLTAALGAAGCSLADQSAPALGGPSEFGLSLTLRAEPDQLPRDGTSQSTITVTALDAQGAPASGLGLKMSASPSTTVLSSAAASTNANGVLTFTVTAPPSSAVGNQILVGVVPVSADAGNAPTRTVTINLLGPSNTKAPEALFTFSPASPTLGQSVTFDASTSKDEDVVCTTCTYAWNFGDGSTGSGVVVSHSYSTAGSFSVTLTVTDAAGSTGTATKAVTVGTGTGPTASVVCSPKDPVVNQQVTCDAAGSKAEVGSTISSYTFVWGDTSANTTTTASKASHPSGTGYGAKGTYTVRVIVTDNFGRTATATAAVEVK